MDAFVVQNILDVTKTLKVVCVGDLMIDRYVTGSVTRVSPEAPIPVLRQNQTRSTLGAVGNVARNVSHLGAQVTMIGVVGDDHAAHEATRLVANEQNIIGELVTARGRATTVKTRYMAGTQQLLRVDNEDPAPLSAEVESFLIEAVVAEMEDADLVLISDYAKGAVTNRLLASITKAASERQTPVLLDPKGVDYQRYGPVNVVKPNARELSEFTRMPTETDEEVKAALLAARDLCSAKLILVTRGARGMSFLDDDDNLCLIPAQAREIYDVSGAGDTVLASLGVALATGADMSQAAGFAVLASGLVVEKIGAAAVTPGELLRAAEVQKPLAGKIMDQDMMHEQLLRWRARGLRVGFTNGCFDLLHPGHVRLLAEAKASCDRLIVGLNSDDSVARLKGPSRPVQDEVARAEVLAALRDVDAVCVFEEDTPLKLIERLVPDVLVKGSDYKIDQVVGGDVVTAAGGEVRLVDLVPGCSTTSAIARCRQDAPA